MKKTTLFAILFVVLTTVGVGGYFIANTIILNYFSGKVDLVSITHSEEVLKGDPLTLHFELDIIGTNRLNVISVEIGMLHPLKESKRG